MNPIVVMHDFFVDRIIRLDSKEEFFYALTEKSRFGGGSIRGIHTVDIKGGNAVNVAYCLAKLGISVILFTIADEIGSAILKQVFSKFGDKVNLHITNGKHGHTTSFEFQDEKKSKINIMVSDVGDNISFGPDQISSEDDLKILRNADGVIVLNWASNKRGTQLTEHVFRNSPKALHFIDPADIETRKQDFKESLSDLADTIDILSINENECNSLAKAVGLDSILVSTSDSNIDTIKHAAKNLAEKIGISVDLHTRRGAAWSNGKEAIFAHAIKVEPKTLTGAGDSWDAADIIGYMAGLDTLERLIFSNACASLYIRSLYIEPPTMSEIFDLLERINF
jgi:ribokinase